MYIESISEVNFSVQDQMLKARLKMLYLLITGCAILSCCGEK